MLFHTLQLAIEVVLSYLRLPEVKLSELSRTLAKCRRLIGHFNRSAKSNYLLKQN